MVSSIVTRAHELLLVFIIDNQQQRFDLTRPAQRLYDIMLHGMNIIDYDHRMVMIFFSFLLFSPIL